MGFFDVLCSATGIPLSGKTVLVLVAELTGFASKLNKYGAAEP